MSWLLPLKPAAETVRSSSKAIMAHGALRHVHSDSNDDEKQIRAFKS